MDQEEDWRRMCTQAGGHFSRPMGVRPPASFSARPTYCPPINHCFFLTKLLHTHMNEIAVKICTYTAIQIFLHNVAVGRLNR